MGKADLSSAYRNNRTICLPISQEEYDAIVDDPKNFRLVVMITRGLCKNLINFFLRKRIAQNIFSDFAGRMVSDALGAME